MRSPSPSQRGSISQPVRPQNGLLVPFMRRVKDREVTRVRPFLRNKNFYRKAAWLQSCLSRSGGGSPIRRDEDHIVIIPKTPPPRVRRESPHPGLWPRSAVTHRYLNGPRMAGRESGMAAGCRIHLDSGLTQDGWSPEKLLTCNSPRSAIGDRCLGGYW